MVIIAQRLESLYVKQVALDSIHSHSPIIL